MNFNDKLDAILNQVKFGSELVKTASTGEKIKPFSPVSATAKNLVKIAEDLEVTSNEVTYDDIDELLMGGMSKAASDYNDDFEAVKAGRTSSLISAAVGLTILKHKLS